MGLIFLEDFEFKSLTGGLRVLLLPDFITLSEKEIGMALLAWIYDLTKKEVETLDVLAEGLSNKMMTEALNLAEDKSVRNRFQSIRRKMGVNNRTEAAAIAVRFGLGAIKGSIDENKQEKE